MINWPFEFEQINDIDVLNYYDILVNKKKLYSKE